VRSSRNERKPDAHSGVADAIGGAAMYPARVAARAWRGHLETAAEDMLSAPEVARVVDRALAGPLPEDLTESLVRHRVVERVVSELAERGELQRLLEEALASPRTLELLDQVLASEAMTRALDKAISGPVRGAMRSQTAGLADQVAGALRHGATAVDERVPQRRAEGRSRFGGVGSRGVALVIDAIVNAVIPATAGAAAGIVASIVGGVEPHWLAGTLLGVGGLIVAAAYFVLFWSTAGQTPGMRLMNVRVRSGRPDGRLSVGRALVRTIGLALAIIPLFVGFVPALFDSRRRALPDYLAGTVVIYDDEPPPPS
jgi:uncharacterized RDD family membrane protein YckC